MGIDCTLMTWRGFPKAILDRGPRRRRIWCERAFFLAPLHANVCLDVASLPPRLLAECSMELEENADKIIFGSDLPGLRSIGQDIGAIRSLPRADDVEAKILRGNAVRLLDRSGHTATSQSGVNGRSCPRRGHGPCRPTDPRNAGMET
jgi:hypothetical protein